MRKKLSGFPWTIYCASPVLAQHAAVSLAGWFKHRREFGNGMKKLLPGYLKREYASIDEQRERHLALLRSLLKHAGISVPYYSSLFRRIGFDPDRINDLEDLRKLPLLTKHIVQENYKNLLSTDHSNRGSYTLFSSGTTGTPLKLKQDHATLVHEKTWVARHRLRHGFKIGSAWRGTFNSTRIVPFAQGKPPYWRINYPGRQVIFSTLHLKKDTIEHYFRKILQSRIKYLDGYPSAIFILARMMNQLGLKIPLKGIFSGAEPIHSFQIEEIEGAFQCPIHDYYGLAEHNIGAGDCPHKEGLHLDIDDCIPEIVDIETGRIITEPGVPGMLVSTSLVNYSMPLIRYTTGDLVISRPGTCPCGRTLPRIDNISTKVKNIIRTPDGRWISGSVITNPIRLMRGIQESQIIQTGNERLVVKIVPSEDYHRSESELLRKRFREIVGEEMSIEVIETSHISRTPAGKFIYVVNEMDHEFAKVS